MGYQTTVNPVHGVVQHCYYYYYYHCISTTSTTHTLDFIHGRIQQIAQSNARTNSDSDFLDPYLLCHIEWSECRERCIVHFAAYHGKLA